MNESCGCCEGLEPLTPLSTANRPGLDTLVYRVGTYATFLETMKARLANGQFPALAHLKTRDVSDPAIALLDAWAIVADVLTFYQERIANEGYLRTATERRSVLELARLVGYTLRPGVSATVFPAFMMEIGYNNKDSEVPAGTRIQSLPGPGEMPQFFETAEKIAARTDWNEIMPRASRPLIINTDNARLSQTVYLKGISTNLRAGDPLLLTFRFEASDVDREPPPVLRKVAIIEPQPVDNQTKVTLQQEALSDIDFLAAVKSTIKKFIELSDFCINQANPEIQTILSFLQRLSAEPSARQLLSVAIEYVRDDQATEGSSSNTDLRNKLFLAVFKLKRYNVESVWLNRLLQELEYLVRSWYLFLQGNTSEASSSVPPVNRQEVLAWANWLMKLYDLSPQQTLDWYLASLANRKFDSDDPSKTLDLEAVIPEFDSLSGVVSPLSQAPSLPPSNRFRLDRQLSTTFKASSDLRARLIETLIPQVETTLYQTLASDDRTPKSPLKAIAAIRVKASVFGANAPLKPIMEDGVFSGDYREWFLDETPPVISATAATALPVLFDAQMITLDAQYDQIQVGSWVLIVRDNDQHFYKVKENQSLSVARFGLSGKVTKLFLEALPSSNTDWFRSATTLGQLRSVNIYAQGEALEVAEESLQSEPVCGQKIDLGTIYDGLKAGRWLIVSGERIDVPNTKASELVMLAGVENPTPDPADSTPYSTIQLSTRLAYAYKRDTVKIYGNVVKATHGETRAEALGSGDASVAFQQFPLRQPPLTYLAAPTPSGAASTLQIRVNDVLWHEVDSLANLKPNDRLYTTKTDDYGMIMAIFGNGQNGSRLPTGVENIRATYRSGIGKVGNVKAEQISQLITRPPGLKGVINPLPSTGGADRENRDRARKNAPLAVMSLDRLVSVQDYEDFSRTFAGIGKASAQRLLFGNRQIVHVTIAGADDIPIDKQSDLYRNLYQALHDFGDPAQPIQLAVRKLVLLVLAAKIRVAADYQWESIEPQIRAALLDNFGFEGRELGQPSWLSEIISIIQHIRGVEYVDVDLFSSLSEDDITASAGVKGKRKILLDGRLVEVTFTEERNNLAIKLDELPQNPPSPIVNAYLARLDSVAKVIVPSQLAIFSPQVADTMILTELKP